MIPALWVAIKRNEVFTINRKNMSELDPRINVLANEIERVYRGEDIEKLKPEIDFFSDFLGFQLLPSEQNSVAYVDAIYGQTVNHLVSLADEGKTEDCEELLSIFERRLEEFWSS